MKTKIFILIALLANTVCSLAQESAQSDRIVQYAQPVEHPSVYSPQVEAMMRYDNSSVNLNTGTVSLTVPLVEFDDPDFDLDVSITYSSDGFKPLQPDNFVGMGWRLNCGGVITREVHGIPDEFGPITVSGGFIGASPTPTVQGFMAAPSSLPQNFIEEKLVNADTMYGEFQHTYLENGLRKVVIRKDGYTEVSPDLYRFSFGKHSGMFMYDIDGTFKVISENGRSYHVQMQNINNIPLSTDFSQIIITTDDGYRYTFGGSYHSLEYSALSWRDFSSGVGSATETIDANRLHCKEIVAWHLTSVQAPNGRNLTYNYFQLSDKNVHDDPAKLLEHNYYSHPDSKKELMKCYQVIPNLKGEGNNIALSYVLNKTPLISSISTDDKSISFTYDNNPSPFFNQPYSPPCATYGFISGCGAKLTDVVLNNSISQFKESVSLSYTTKENRLLLSSVKNDNKGVYNLDYYSSGTFRNSITIDIDKWGFWSGAGTNTSFMQQADDIYWNCIDPVTGDFYRHPNDTNREPTGKEYDAFMLKTVMFPTGGSISYEYEPHTYSSYFHKPSPIYYGRIDGVNSFSKLAGGARVCKETFVDKISPKNRIKRYVYEREDGRSNGFLRTEGENYLKPYPISKYGSQPVDPMQSSTPCLPTSCYNIVRNNSMGGYISYSEIIEYDFEGAEPDTLDRDMPHKVTEYMVDTDMVAYPNVVAFVSDTITTYDHQVTLGEIGFLTNYYAVIPDYSKTVGKIRSESFYAHGRRLIKKTEYSYSTRMLGVARYVNGYPGVSASYVGCYSQLAKVPLYHHLLTDKKTYEYDEDGRVKISSTSYTYNHSGDITSFTVVDSDGRNIQTSYKYPEDFHNMACAHMRHINMHPIISETVEAGGSEVIYKKLNEYKLISRDDPSVTITEPLIEIPHDAIPVLSAIYDTYGDGEPNKQIDYVSYDRYNNPLWIKSDNRDYVYVWGDFGKNLIAIVENATEPQVSEVLGVDYLDVISSYPVSAVHETFPEIGNTLRSSLPNSLVTSYTYLPGVGVASQTTPDGQTIYYEYDVKGRLSYIYRMDGDVKSIIEKYDYNLVNE